MSCARSSAHRQCLTTRRMTSGEIRVVADSGGKVSVRIPPGQGSQSNYTLEVGEPVVSNDLPARPASRCRRSSSTEVCTGA